MKQKTLYWDLDDCLAHFTPYVNEIFDTKYKIGETMELEHWKHVRENHQRIFRSLRPNEGAIETLYKILSLKNAPQIRLLTALPFDDRSLWQYAPSDKLLWCQKHLIGIPVFFGPYAHDKKNHCEVGDILIDDKESNHKEWIDAGGVAHLYRGNDDELFEFVKERL